MSARLVLTRGDIVRCTEHGDSASTPDPAGVGSDMWYCTVDRCPANRPHDIRRLPREDDR